MAIRNVTKDIFDSNSTKGYVKVSILDYSRKNFFKPNFPSKSPIFTKKFFAQAPLQKIC